MRKKIFLTVLLTVALMCMLALTSLAVEVTTLDEIKTGISNATAGDELVFDLGADILIPDKSSAIVIDKDITVTINTNGYLIYANPGSGGAGTVYGFRLNSLGAKLIFNGALTEVDYINYVKPDYEAITLSNGEIVNQNPDKGYMTPDFASNGPAIVVHNGTLELNNMYMRQSNSGEWGVVFIQSDGEYVHNANIKNCIMLSSGGSYPALGMRNKGGTLKESKVCIENSVLDGIGANSNFDSYFSGGAGSYLRDVRISEYSVAVDSNANDSTIFGRNENTIPFERVIFGNSNVIHATTGRIHINMIDCTFPENYTMSLSSDGQGNSIVYITTSASCESAGSKIKHEYNADPVELTDFATENPALGHDASGDAVTIAYTNGFASAGFCDFNCSRCNEQYTESEATAPAIIEPLGYSYKETGSGGITGGYALNNSALALYEKITGDTVVFGIVVINPEYAGDSFFTDKKLTVTDKAVQVEITDNTYASFSYSLTGFESGFEELDLVISAYAYSNTNELEFIQKQYDEGETSAAFDTFAKSDATLYSVNCASVKNADPDYVAPTKEEE